MKKAVFSGVIFRCCARAGSLFFFLCLVAGLGEVSFVGC
jgi:hypothetical protein